MAALITALIASGFFLLTGLGLGLGTSAYLIKNNNEAHKCQMEMAEKTIEDLADQRGNKFFSAIDNVNTFISSVREINQVAGTLYKEISSKNIPADAIIKTYENMSVLNRNVREFNAACKEIESIKCRLKSKLASVEKQQLKLNILKREYNKQIEAKSIKVKPIGHYNGDHS